MNTNIQKKKRKKIDWRNYVIFLPGFLFVFLFTFYPMAKMVVMSFFDWNIGYNQISPFVGLENYIDVLSDPTARLAIGNTFAYAFVTVPLQIVIGLLVAVLIHGIVKGSVGFRLGYYFPVISSWVVVALLFRYIFSNFGLLNYVLTDVLHLVDEPIGWLSSRWSALFAAMMLGVWKGVGWNMVVFLAALQAVPKDQYEAADIDGANRFQKFFQITLPNIRGTMLFVIIMLSIGAFNTYTPITMLTGGNPAHQTEVVLTWMYFETFSAYKMGYSAAFSVIVAIIIIAITVILFSISRWKRRDA
jgi:multiple sugar transport system permease protein